VKFGWSVEDVKELREEIEGFANVVHPLETVHVCVDPDDDRILECANAARSDFVVTGDKHLLRIGEWRAIKIKNKKLAEFSPHDRRGKVAYATGPFAHSMGVE
jgi:predicted nucleic acid-binding protein